MYVLMSIDKLEMIDKFSSKKRFGSIETMGIHLWVA